MTLTTLLVHDVTILTAGVAEDRYSNDVKDWETVSSRTVKGWISQRDRTEERDRREALISDWVLFLHADETITGFERVQWEGNTFEVNGPANPAWSPGGRHHLEVPLRVVTG